MYRGAFPAQSGHVMIVRPPTHELCWGSSSTEGY